MRIPERTAQWLAYLAKRCEIFLATSLPLEAAKRKLAPVWHMVRGGVFANGGRWRIQRHSGEGGCMDVVVPMETYWLERAKEKGKAYGFTVHVYRKGKDIYKVTLSFRRTKKGMQMPGQKSLVRDLEIPSSCQVLWEGNCMQVTKKGTGKLEGVLEICKEMGYQKEDVMAFGDSENDRAMLEYFSKEG